MNEFSLFRSDYFQLIWFVLIAAALMSVTAWWRVTARQRFATSAMLAKIFPEASRYRRALVNLCPLLVLTLLTLCLVDIRWGEVRRELPQRGIEVMFLLDISRSMLAEDVAPNRLERAKQMIKDTVEEMAGDRIGLTVFAGEARQRIPMTNHYEDFNLALDQVQPEDLAKGGSRLGEAIRVAAKGFLSKLNDHRAIVILTDGEDQESQPIEVAREVFSKQQIRIFTIGLGDFRQGGRVPVTRNGERGFLQYEGEQVWSKLDGKILSAVAKAASGDYIPAGTKLVKMADFYRGYLASMDQMEFETAEVNRLEARFQWFLLLALLIHVWEIFLLSTVKRREGRAIQETFSPDRLT